MPTEEYLDLLANDETSVFHIEAWEDVLDPDELETWDAFILDEQYR